jgi:RNA polymerase sigma factor (TIGR02999 family)
MNPASASTVTQLLRAWSNGDQTARERLIPLVYEELRRVAHNYLRRERPGQMMQTTALVHEAYLRLVEIEQATWQDRGHFFAVAARIMRHILVDIARSRRAPQVSLVEVMDVAPAPARDLVALDEALDALAQLDPRKSQIVELRFFGGLSVEETAETLQISRRTVNREWNAAKAWLYRELSGGHGHEA